MDHAILHGKPFGIPLMMMNSKNEISVEGAKNQIKSLNQLGRVDAPRFDERSSFDLGLDWINSFVEIRSLLLILMHLHSFLIYS
jgi:hypothetical protein